MNTSQGKAAKIKIPQMFAKALPNTKCPICESPATHREIERHLDNGCPQPVNLPITKSDSKVDPKLPPENGQTVCRNSEKETAFDKESDDYFDDSDTDYEKVDLDNVLIDSQSKTDPEMVDNDEPIFRASQTLSNAPNRFGGLADLSALGHVNFK